MKKLNYILLLLFFVLNVNASDLPFEVTVTAISKKGIHINVINKSANALVIRSHIKKRGLSTNWISYNVVYVNKEGLPKGFNQPRITLPALNFFPYIHTFITEGQSCPLILQKAEDLTDLDQIFSLDIVLNYFNPQDYTKINTLKKNMKSLSIKALVLNEEGKRRLLEEKKKKLSKKKLSSNSTSPATN